MEQIDDIDYINLFLTSVGCVDLWCLVVYLTRRIVKEEYNDN